MLKGQQRSQRVNELILQKVKGWGKQVSKGIDFVRVDRDLSLIGVWDAKHQGNLVKDKSFYKSIWL
jgi:hypothetical protein